MSEMIDISDTTIAKSDQLNAEDLLAGPQTLVITGAKKVNDDKQPVHLDYEGGEGRPWKPCKGMRKVLVLLWGKDASKYAGRKVMVYNEPRAVYAGKEVGGIRICGMSEINKEHNVPITESRGKKIIYKIKPIIDKPLNKLSAKDFEAFNAEFEAAESIEGLSAIGKKVADGEFDADGNAKLKELYRAATKRLRD